MSRFIVCIFAFFVLSFTISPVHADWCRDPVNKGVIQCVGAPTVSWTDCGTYHNETLWCYPSGGAHQSRSKSHDATNAILIGAGVGLAVVAVAWYFFGKAPSKNSPGQIQLATF